MVTTFNVRILPGSFALGRPQPQTAFVCLSRDLVRLFQLKGSCRPGKWLGGGFTFWASARRI